MLKNIIIFIIFIVISTILVIIFNPRLEKSVSFSSSKNLSVDAQNNINTKEIHLNAKNNITQENTHNVQPVENTKQSVAQNTVESVNNLVSREEYMQQMKERAKRKYEEFLALKAQEEKEKTVVKTEPAKKEEPKTQPQQKTIGFEIFDPEPQKTVSKPAAKQNTKPKQQTTVPAKQQQKPVQTGVKKQQTTPSERTKTAQEQSISLEKWRNQINSKIISSASMQMPNTIPTGTKYSYSFYVDKNKNISDVQVSVVNNSSNQAAKSGINTIKNCIKIYEKNSILQFPADVSISKAKVAAYITITR